MAKSNNKTSRVRYRDRKTKSYRRKAPEIHAVPAILETVGVLYPGLNSSSNENGGWPNVFSSSNPTLESKLGAVKGGLEGYANIGSDIDAGIMILAGVVARWVGKKTGLNKIGTKRIKLF